MIKLILLLGLCGALSYAETSSHDELVHFSAHFGMSYALNTFVYGVMAKGLGCSQNDSLATAVITTIFVGAIYKFMELQVTPGQFETSMLYNATGILASGITIKLFDF